MKMAQISPEFKIFFNHFRDLFSLKQFGYFSIYVYSLVVLPKEQQSVRQISQAQVEPLCRSSLSRLLSEVSWDFKKVMRRSQRQIMRLLSQHKKDKRRIQLVIDDTNLDKFGPQIFGAAWFKHRKNEAAFFALNIVVLGILIDDWLVPLDFHIYVKETDCQRIRLYFESKLDQAAKMVRKLRIPHNFHVEVMFDSWYLHKKVTQAIETRGWYWISRLAKNRRVTWQGEQKSQQLQEYLPEVKWQQLYYTTQRKRRAVVGHQRIGRFKGVGRSKVVFSSLEERSQGKWAFFCTNHTRLPMLEVIRRYEKRWKVEVFFKEARKCLGLEKWQFRCVTSVVRHLCLVMVAAMALAWLRLQQKKQETFRSWGEFVTTIQKGCQRDFLRWFFEQSKTKKYSNFNELYESIGL